MPGPGYVMGSAARGSWQLGDHVLGLLYHFVCTVEASTPQASWEH